MKITDMLPSSYLKQADIDQPYLVTVQRFEHKNVAQSDAEPEMKWIVFFSEFEKGMVLNPTNIQLAAQAMGSEDTDDWIGRQLVIFTDPSVSFGGKLVGGLRIRAVKKRPVAIEGSTTAGMPRAQVALTNKQRPVSQDFADEDIPF